jgi:hypothetical protein
MKLVIDDMEKLDKTDEIARIMMIVTAIMMNVSEDNCLK